MSDQFNTAVVTLSLLEWRLRRLEHYLGSEEVAEDESGGSENPPAAIGDRLNKLDRELSKIISANPQANELLRIRGSFPELFDEQIIDEQTRKSELSHQLPVVLSSASDYTNAVSRLTTLQQYRVPDAEELTPLWSLEPSLRRMEATQHNQMLQIQELRQRSAALLARWHENYVLGSGAAWSSLESRVLHADQRVRRGEAALAREREVA